LKRNLVDRLDDFRDVVGCDLDVIHRLRHRRDVARAGFGGGVHAVGEFLGAFDAVGVGLRHAGDFSMLALISWSEAAWLLALSASPLLDSETVCASDSSCWEFSFRRGTGCETGG